MDKNEAVKKIKFQTSKRKKGLISDEKKLEMVQGILDANIDKEFVIKSEMPEQIMGVKVDWNDNKAVEVIIKERVEISKQVIEDCNCGEDCDCGDDCECKD